MLKLNANNNIATNILFNKNANYTHKDAYFFIFKCIRSIFIIIIAI
jgi:hypothetical protein